MMANHHGAGNKPTFVKFITVHELKLMDGALFQTTGCIHLLFNLPCSFLDRVIEFDECDINLTLTKSVLYPL